MFSNANSKKKTYDITNKCQVFFNYDLDSLKKLQCRIVINFIELISSSARISRYTKELDKWRVMESRFSTISHKGMLLCRFFMSLISEDTVGTDDDIQNEQAVFGLVKGDAIINGRVILSSQLYLIDFFDYENYAILYTYTGLMPEIFSKMDLNTWIYCVNY